MRVSQLLGGAVGALLVVVVVQACGDSATSNAPAAGGANEGGAGGEPSTAAGGSDGVLGPGGAAPGEGGAPNAVAGAGAGGEVAAGGANGCPDGAPGKPPSDYLAQFGSGTRLEARYYAAAGMPKAFAGFFDSKLGVWCDFLRASDDKLRCLPRTTASSLASFGDAQCKKQVRQVSHACATGAGGYFREQLECADKVAVHAGETYSGALYGGSAANCTKVDATTSPDSVLISDELAPSNFVAGELRELPGVCNASLRLVEATDGSVGPYEVVDVTSGAGCETNAGLCRPRRLAYEEPGLFTDPTCQTAPTSVYASAYSAASCGAPDLVRLGGAVPTYNRPGPLATLALYSVSSGCGPALEKPWIKAIYEVSDTVVPLVTFERQLLGTGRLRLPVVGEAGTPLMAAVAQEPSFQDSQLGAPCLLRPTADGTLLCLPSEYASGPAILDEYNDKDCTQPIRRCQGADCSGSIVYDEELDPESCSSERLTTNVWQLKAPATAYFRKDDQFPCYAAGAVGSDMWTVDLVDTKDLVRATLETTP